MPNLRLRENAMWSEQFQHQNKSITGNTPDQQPYWLQSQCNSKPPHEMSSTSIMRDYKSNRGNKVTWCLHFITCGLSHRVKPRCRKVVCPWGKRVGHAYDTRIGGRNIHRLLFW